MCLFHKWGKWSEVKEEVWERRKSLGGIETDRYTYVRRCQERYCEKCGKHSQRYLD